jgi:hypothetical protein
MLNVPALGLGLAALYHFRRWLDSSPLPPPLSATDISRQVTGQGLHNGERRRHLPCSLAMAVSAALTYFTAGVVVLIGAAWLTLLRRDLFVRMVLILSLIVLLCLPVLFTLSSWSPVHFSYLTPSRSDLLQVANWTYYLETSHEILGWPVLVLGSIGAIVGLCGRQARRESVVLLVWLAVLYVVFSFLVAKESRYLLLACPPVICFCAIGLYSFARCLTGFIAGWKDKAWGVTLAGVFLLLGTEAWSAARSSIPFVNGLKEIVTFFDEVAPAEPLFYDGIYDAVFVFRVQAGDPEYRRRVVLGSKLLYASAVVPGWRLHEFVSTRDEVVRTLQTKGGCRWLAIEHSADSEKVPTARLLRETVHGPEFELVRVFPFGRSGSSRVEVYRFLLPVETPDDVELPFPVLGEGVGYRVKPISR